MKLICSLLLCFLATSSYAEGWLKDKNTGCKVWTTGDPSRRYIIWSGKCKDGYVDGEGTVEWYKFKQKGPSMGDFMGEYKVIMTGKGSYKNGQANGKWDLIDIDGKKKRKRISYYSNGVVNKTITIAPDGKKYELNYKDGKPYGKGSFIYVDGTFYTGKWNGSELQCTVQFSNGDKYVGRLENSKKNGKGTQFYSSGYKYVKYVGDWVDNTFHGQGTLTYPSGDKYSGGWLKGKKHGMGTNTFPDGNSYKALWENGVRIKIF